MLSRSAALQFLLLTFAGWVNRRQQGVIAYLGEIAEADFFTVEVLSYVGLLRYYVLFVIDIQTRKVNIAGISHQPHGRWMEQIARNLTDAEEGFLGRMRSNCHEFRPQRCGRLQLRWKSPESSTT